MQVPTSTGHAQIGPFWLPALYVGAGAISADALAGMTTVWTVAARRPAVNASINPIRSFFIMICSFYLNDFYLPKTIPRVTPGSHVAGEICINGEFHPQAACPLKWSMGSYCAFKYVSTRDIPYVAGKFR
jgi:hypothetical protein